MMGCSLLCGKPAVLPLSIKKKVHLISSVVGQMTCDISVMELKCSVECNQFEMVN